MRMISDKRRILISNHFFRLQDLNPTMATSTVSYGSVSL